MEGSRFVRIAVESDIPFIADNMRIADVNEVWSSHRHTPLQSLEASFKTSSLIWTMEHVGNPVVMFGVASGGALSDTGYPWLLGTDLMYKVTLEFLRYSRYYVNKMLRMFDVLENWVDIRNDKSVRWLQWCGFQLEKPEPWGFDNLLFSHFTMERCYV